MVKGGRYPELGEDVTGCRWARSRWPRERGEGRIVFVRSGALISKEDINQKFLRSLPSSWNHIALIMRNKPDIDEIDIDDLYNNLRVYEDELKRSLGSNSASQNLAFLSSENTNSTNEVSTASGDFGVSTAGGINQVPSTPSAHDIAYSFLEQPTTSPQLENEDFQKWHFARECRSGRSQGRRPYGDKSNAQTTESSSRVLVALDGLGGYDWSNDFEVEPVNYAWMAISSSNSSSSSDSENELAWGERYELQNYDLKCREIKINNLNLELEKVVKERDELKLKIEKWEGSSTNLTKILNSQMSTHDKNGLGFGIQIDDLSNKFETDSENSSTVFEVRSSDEESTLANNRFTKANEYHVVPPPITGNPLTPRSDISFAGLDEYVFRNKIIESKTTETNKTMGTTNEATIVKPKFVNETVVSKSKINMKSPLRIGPQMMRMMCVLSKLTGHLIKDCDFYDQKSPEPRVKNLVNTRKREVKPVWDYGKRVNHQNFSKNWKYPHAKRTFNPSAVLTRAGLVNTVRSNVSTARPLASKISQSKSVIRPNHPRLDIVRPKALNSPIKRSYFTQPVKDPET
ncbi:hypothetical protein Tco_0210817 [Tanacetum coccineum]